ncbi:MAG: hypothetical protein JW901_11465 [Dehalococcoidia bacterium]|nr:hypothetical protein [Dehalococcoidia bacterium]
MRLRQISGILLVFVLVALSLAGCNYLPGEISGMSFLPVAHTFQASPTVVKAGEYSTLSWSVTDASKVFIDNGVGNVAVQGSIVVTPAQTTQYTLTAYNSSGSTTARTQVVVTGAVVQQVKQPSIRYFSSDKTYVTPGGDVTLHWSTVDATLVSLEPGGVVGAQGSIIVHPYVTTNYTLIATNTYGVVSDTLTVYTGTAGVIYQSGQEISVTLPAIAAETGALVKNNAVYTFQEGACVGDTTLNLPSRAFLSFDISGVPRNAVVTDAVLDLSSYGKVGNPTYDLSMYGNMGALQIYFFQYGGLSDLDTMAYNRPGKPVSGGDITDYPQSPWLVDVLNSSSGEHVVQDLVQSGQSRCQFRMQLFTTTNWDGVRDMLCFDDAKLIVKYRVP